jgi:hypothetical protein
MAFQIKSTSVISDATGANNINGYTITSPTRDGTGGVFSLAGSVFQGTVSGYSIGGGGPITLADNIEKYSFVSDANGTTVGSLTIGRYTSGSAASTVSGYSVAGNYDGQFPGITANKSYEKFPFASDANAKGVGKLAFARWRPYGGSSSSTHGYTGGGQDPAVSPAQNYASVTTEKFPFSSDSDSQLIGKLTYASYQLNTGHSSPISGYVLYSSPAPINGIQKFQFATDSTATTLVTTSTIVPLRSYGQGAGISSLTFGYIGGTSYPGTPAPYGVSNQVKMIEKFSFSSDGACSAVGQLTQARYGAGASSSTVSGYTHGGYGGSPVATVVIIDKFPFATDTNATSVGQLVTGREEQSGANARTLS